MFDLSFLNNMMGGNEQLVKKFLEIFKSQVPLQLEELSSCIDQENWEGVSITSHSLKSQFNYLNLKSLAEQIGKIEILADENQTEGIKSLAQKVEEEVNKVLEMERSL